MNTQPKSYPIAASYAPLIARARVYDVAIESPLDRAPRLSARLGHDVLLEARRPASRVLVQAARRVQQDRADAATPSSRTA